MNTLQKRLNQLSDMNWGWWPVLHLRPRKNEELSTRRLLLITLVFGSASALGMITYRFAKYDKVTLQDAVTSALLGWLLFFVIYRFTFARAWNARAEELRKQA